MIMPILSPSIDILYLEMTSSLHPLISWYCWLFFNLSFWVKHIFHTLIHYNFVALLTKNKEELVHRQFSRLPIKLGNKGIHIQVCLVKRKQKYELIISWAHYNKRYIKKSPKSHVLHVNMWQHSFALFDCL